MVVADPDEALIEAIAEAIFVDEPCVKPWKYDQCWVHEHSGFDDPSPSPRCDYVLGRARAAYAAMVENLGLVEKTTTTGPMLIRRLVSRWVEVDHGSE
jgi:hypothetical protein